MSEEDIIKGINKMLNECDRYFDECGTYLHLAGKEEQDLVQGLLDLYNKEKEKNKEIEEINFKVNYNLIKTTEQLETLKDKIREKQMYYEKMLREEKWGEKTELGLRNRIVALQELLEERN